MLVGNMTSKNTVLSLIEQNPVTVKLASPLAVRLYPDCRPCCLETSILQKGLVLLLNGEEVVEEGVGFGLPIVKYADKTFFSSKAEISMQRIGDRFRLTKTFVIDTVSVKKLGNNVRIHDRLYSPLRKTFQLLYLKHKRLNPLFNAVMETRNLFGVKTEFETVNPRGTVTVTYDCHPNQIKIHADLSNIKLTNCQQILMLNEQGSNIFQTYTDNTRTLLRGDRIGAWDRVETDAAALLSSQSTFGFSVFQVRGALLYRGWENTRGRFSWAGLSYSLKPGKTAFDYTIELLCSNKQ